MSRETSDYIYGDYWLDKRRDGAAADIWQAATYKPGTRSVVYRSTKCRTEEIEAAKEALRAIEAEARSKSREQDPEEAQILPHLINYVREHGPEVKRLDTVVSSFRAWIGFLEQDELTTGAVVADIDKNMVARFVRWRSGPHAWSITWDGEDFYHQSEGVSGKTIQRNIEDLRAALHHAEANRRFVAPKVFSVPKNKIKRNPRETIERDTLAAIVGYARHDRGLHRELCLQLATACRPGHAQRFDPATQWHDDILDLQPEREDETDKRAAVLPVIEPLRPILRDWKENPHDPVKSRKRAWRTMRRVLGLPKGMDAYAIRTTVSTMLDDEGTPGGQISGIVGHLPESRGVARTTAKHYLRYDPRNCDRAVEVLTTFFNDITERADAWLADHMLTTPVRGKPIELARRDGKVLEFRQKVDGGR